jgi:predicted  nucleic acid-binding Zn-ribbon protein
MPAFNDASCPKCGRRFGWVGEMIDRPPCPKCGHQIPKEELQEADEEMEKFRQLLRDRKAKKDKK